MKIRKINPTLTIANMAAGFLYGATACYALQPSTEALQRETLTILLVGLLLQNKAITGGKMIDLAILTSCFIIAFITKVIAIPLNNQQAAMLYVAGLVLAIRVCDKLIKRLTKEVKTHQQK